MRITGEKKPWIRNRVLGRGYYGEEAATSQKGEYSVPQKKLPIIHLTGSTRSDNEV